MVHACPAATVRGHLGTHLQIESQAALTGCFSGRGSVDSLGQGHDDPFGSTHRRHAPDALVFTHAADQVVAVRRAGRAAPAGRPRRKPRSAAQFIGHGVGRSLFVVWAAKLASSSPVPPSGGRSRTISVREFGMPTTVSRNSPSRAVRPSVSKPSPTKNTVTWSRSATVMPT